MWGLYNSSSKGILIAIVVIVAMVMKVIIFKSINKYYKSNNLNKGINKLIYILI